MNKDDIIFRIGNIRREANLSGRALSLRLNKNDSYINRLESVKDFLPTMEVFLQILEECNCSVEKFFYHNPKSYEKDMEFLSSFDKLTDEKKEALLKLIK